MRSPIGIILRSTLVLAVVSSATGCVAAAAGAGAAAAVALTEQGAQGMVPGSLATVDARAQAVFREMGITVSERKEQPTGIEYHGKGNGRDVSVEVVAGANNTTTVKASARKNAVSWDKGYARSIVERIVKRS
jgi:hypothetical protein